MAAAGGERHFSTDFLKASERTPYFREVIGRSVARVDLIPVEDRPLKWSMRAQALDGLVVVSQTTTGLVAHRTQEMLSDGDDDLLFGINRSGFSLAAARPRPRATSAASRVAPIASAIRSRDVAREQLTDLRRRQSMPAEAIST